MGPVPGSSEDWFSSVFTAEVLETFGQKKSTSAHSIFNTFPLMEKNIVKIAALIIFFLGNLRHF